MSEDEFAFDLSVTIPSIPVSQPRQRHRVITGKNGKPFAANYTPKNDPVNSFKATVRHAVRERYSGPPLDCPLLLVLSFVFPRPTTKRWKTKPMPREWHIGSKDIDNLSKSVMDALNGMLWVDDNRIVTLTATKWIASGDESPHVQLRVIKCGQSDQHEPKPEVMTENDSKLVLSMFGDQSF